MKPKSVFNNPEAVREQLALPAVVDYSFVGPTQSQYHARIEEIVTRIAGEDNIRKRTLRQSSAGTYTAYKFEVYHTDFEDVEAIYREVGALEGTRFIV